MKSLILRTQSRRLPASQLRTDKRSARLEEGSKVLLARLSRLKEKSTKLPAWQLRTDKRSARLEEDLKEQLMRSLRLKVQLIRCLQA